MGQIAISRLNTIESKKKNEQKQAVLDVQNVAATNAEQVLDAQDIIVMLTEQLAEKDQQILDLQDMVVSLSEQITTLNTAGGNL